MKSPEELEQEQLEQIAKSNSENLDKAMDELDQIAKAQGEEKDELDELTKALEEELGDDLSKGHKEPDGDEDDKGKEPVGQDENDEDLDKSQDDGFDEELVKASEAFASLEKSVRDMTEGLSGEVGSLKKSMAALLNLNIKQAKVIASLAKSRDEDGERIAKSLEALAGAPMAPNKAVIGTGSSVETETLKKSHSEIQEALQKAISEGKVAAGWLSNWGTHKDVNRFPEDVKTAIGL